MAKGRNVCSMVKKDREECQVCSQTATREGCCRLADRFRQERLRALSKALVVSWIPLSYSS
ncbi:MAG: hypothetical protein PHC85_02790 [Candidatus Pacebacteria bacterium]|nr:hypothetical protein [Candidatus Paceibacterota bacterium]